MKTLGLFAAGVLFGVIGLLVFDFGDADNAATAEVEPDEKFEAFRREVDARLSSIEDELQRLDGNLQAVEASGRIGSPAAVRTPAELAAAQEAARARVQEMQERLRLATPASEAERLAAAGFSPDRIAWVDRRIDEIQVSVQQAQYNAQQGGEPLSAEMAAMSVNPLIGLRDDMDDAEFERYLAALGRPTAVNVSAVLASSSADAAGLQSGDEIVSYDGRRVFSIAELNVLTSESRPGRSVVVEARRDGQRMQVVVPPGPLGVSTDLGEELFGGRSGLGLPPRPRPTL